MVYTKLEIGIFTFQDVAREDKKSFAQNIFNIYISNCRKFDAEHEYDIKTDLQSFERLNLFSKPAIFIVRGQRRGRAKSPFDIPILENF